MRLREKKEEEKGKEKKKDKDKEEWKPLHRKTIHRLGIE
jgi:hypothetical protein